MADTNRVDECIIKFKRNINIPQPITTGKSYRIALDTEITEATKKLNEDGTYNLIFTAEIEKGEVLKETGDILISKDNGTQSQKLRKQIYAIGEDYDKVMNIIRSNLEEIIKDYLYNI